MGRICEFATKVEDDLYLCSKHQSYCYFDTPDKKVCENNYYNIDDDNVLSEEENGEE